ncbi:SPOR domain-containing protein [Methylobacter sp. S3L5C]|uniref:SPOR domain-containing protein n=1 Tax=Methylobacter sp. S3L5C TaxID=2839024 RepID=UPI001FAB88C0|nr:SPOR domain-containing protein [Methylobacter sp. S3L5C]UOA08030.1 SPOR domain-containing protein [Methylobacter sp. S3L5C]
MTKKQKHRRNSFSADVNAGEDDFILVDLDVMSGKEYPSPVTLNNFSDDEEIIDRLLVRPDFKAYDELKGNHRNMDNWAAETLHLTDSFSASALDSNTDLAGVPDEEDAIDRLLVDTGFDANQWAGKNKEADAKAIDDIDLAGELSNVDQFFIKPFEQTEQTLLAASRRSTSDLDEPATKNTDDNEIQEALVIDGINQAGELTVPFKEQNAILTDKNIFKAKKSVLLSDKALDNNTLKTEDKTETISQAQSDTKIIYRKEVANKDPEATSFNSIKTKQNAIKKQQNAPVNNIKKSNLITYTALSFAIAAVLASIVMAIIIANMQTKMSKLTDMVSIIEEDSGSGPEKNADMDLNNSDISIEQLNQKINELGRHLPEINNLETRTSELEKKLTLQKQIMGQSQASLEQSKNNTKAIASINKSIDKQNTNASHLAEKKSASVKPASSEKKIPNTKTASGWSVNLSAYKKQSDAKRKADQLIQKGIPVKVIEVDMNNTKWYRLKLGSFKNKTNANSYAARIKKSHHLNNISVDNK